MENQSAFFGMLMVLLMSNTSIVILFPWHRLRYISGYPNRAAFAVTLFSLLWEEVPQILVESWAFTLEDNPTFSSLLALCGSTFELIYTLLTTAMVLASVDNKRATLFQADDEDGSALHATLMHESINTDFPVSSTDPGDNSTAVADETADDDEDGSALHATLMHESINTDFPVSSTDPDDNSTAVADETADDDEDGSALHATLMHESMNTDFPVSSYDPDDN